MRPYLTFLTLGLSLFIISCNENEDTEIDKYINNIQTFPYKVDTSIITSTGPSTENIYLDNVSGLKYKCEETPSNLAQRFTDIVAFKPNAGVLYPGALINGKSLRDGDLAPINLTRNSGTLSIHGVSRDSSNKVGFDITVDTASQQKINNAINLLIDRIPTGQQVADMYITQSEGYETNQSLLQVGVSASWLKQDLKAQYQRSSSSFNSKMIVKVVQRYYDISFETNKRNKVNSQLPSSFFIDGTTLSDVKTQITDTVSNPPCYIKSITYGRILLLEFESSASLQELRTAISGKFGIRSFKASADLEITSKRIIENSSVKMLSLGGAAEASIEFLNGGSLDEYLLKGANFTKNSPAFPISYSARNIKDDGLTQVSYSTKFNKKDCKTNPRQITQIAVTFHNIIDNKDKGEGITFTVFKDNQIIGRRESIGVNVVWQKGTNDGWTIPLDRGNADEFDRSKLKVNISKNGNKGFYCKPTTMTVYFNDGSTEEWFRLDGDFIMGEGHSNDQTFSLRR
jgi:thiol-activated cytolysin